MAQKRMFSLAVTDTDTFLDMPTSTQALYFHLGMHGDDDGFVGSPKKIARAAGCNEDDLKVLAAKGFIIPFDSGVVVIRDWKINNTLKNDRYHETVYAEEKAMLSSDSAGRYQLVANVEPIWNQLGSTVEPEHNVTERNIAKQSKDVGADEPPRAARFVPPSLDEVLGYCLERGNTVNAQAFIDHYEANGWMRGKTKIKDWKACVRTWESNQTDITTPRKYVKDERSL